MPLSVKSRLDRFAKRAQQHRANAGVGSFSTIQHDGSPSAQAKWFFLKKPKPQLDLPITQYLHANKDAAKKLRGDFGSSVDSQTATPVGSPLRLAPCKREKEQSTLALGKKHPSFRSLSIQSKPALKALVSQNNSLNQKELEKLL